MREPHSAIIQNLRRPTRAAEDPSCRSGGTGRHVRLRGVWGDPWGFESPLRHQEINPPFWTVYIRLCGIANKSLDCRQNRLTLYRRIGRENLRRCHVHMERFRSRWRRLRCSSELAVLPPLRGSPIDSINRHDAWPSGCNFLGVPRKISYSRPNGLRISNSLPPPSGLRKALRKFRMSNSER